MAYGMSKAAMERMTVDAAEQLRPFGIAVNTFRIDVPVASEGFVANLPDVDHDDWEPTEVPADGILWMLRQPPTTPATTSAWSSCATATASCPRAPSGRSRSREASGIPRGSTTKNTNDHKGHEDQAFESLFVCIGGHLCSLCSLVFFVFSGCGGFVTRATIAILTMLMASGAGAQQTLCPGDCAVDGEVQVTDVVIMINVINGSRPLDDCRAGDFDHNARIRANDVTRAVRSILDGCSPGASGRRRSTAR